MASIVDEVKRKVKSQGFSTESKVQQTSQKSSGYKGSAEYQQIKSRIKSAGISFDDIGVNQDYINSFVKDADTFFNTAQKDYESVGWGNATSVYDSKSKTYSDLYDRWRNIKSWVNVNKNNIDESTYNNLTKVLANFSKNASSVVKGFEDSKKFYSQFDTEDDYNSWNANRIAKEQQEQEIMSAEDFGEYSKIGADAATKLNKGLPTGDNIIAGYRGGYGNITGLRGMMSGSGKMGMDVSMAQAMTENEANIYNYYFAKYGEEKANEYYDSIKDTLSARVEGKSVENIQNVIDKNPVWGSLTASALSPFITTASAAEYVGDLVTGDSRNHYAAVNAALRQKVAEKVDWEIGNWDAFDFVYNTGMSMADTLVAGTMFGSVGGGITLGLSAAASATNDALDRGMSKKKAFWNGLFAGVFEGLFETISLGQFSALKEGAATSFKQIAKNLGKTMLVNASEETATEIANIAYDTFVNADLSNYSLMVKEYIANGMTEEDAKKKALLGLAGQVAEAAASGALMGFGMGAIGNGIGYYNASKKGAAYKGSEAELISEALEIDPDNANAQNLKGRLESGKKVSSAALYGLAQQNESTMLEQDRSAIQKAAAERLTALGETGDVAELSKALAKYAESQKNKAVKLSPYEKNLIKENENAQKVAKELSGSSDWVGKIGTNSINYDEYNKGITEETTPTAENPSPAVAKAVATTDNAPSTEIPTEGKIEASENAKITIERDGKEVEVNVAEFASIEDGKVKLQDGEVVNADEINFGGNGVGLVYQAAIDMASRVGGFNTDTANTFVRGYDAESGITSAEYINGWISAYKFGALKNPPPLSALAANPTTAKLTEKLRERAYNFGKAFGNDPVANNQEKIASTEAINADKNANKASKKREGKVHFDGVKYGKNLNERQRASLKALNFLSKALGIDIYVEESEKVNGKRIGENGWYDPTDRSVHIDLYAGAEAEALMLFTAAHELTHHIREVLPDKFNILADAVFEEYTKRFGDQVMEDLIEAKTDFLKEKGRITEDMTEEEAYDLAYEEVISDCCETMLTDSNAMEALSKNIYAKDKGLWRRIVDFFTGLVERFKAAYADAIPDSEEGQRFRDLGEGAERIKKLWVEAIVEASEVSDIADIDANTESVAPTFNMDEAKTMLDEYKGGHSSYPVAHSVVDKFIDEYNKKNGVKASDRVSKKSDFSSKESESLDNSWGKSYNLYTETDDFVRDVTYNDRHDFARSLANKTSGMVDGDTKTIHIYCRDKVYTFVANGYMKGYISMSEYVDIIDARKRRFKEYYENDVDSNGTVVGLWSKSIPNQSGRQADDTWVSSRRRGPTSDDSLLENTSDSTRKGNNERVRENTYSQEEVDEIVKKLSEMYGLGAKKHSDRASQKASYLAMDVVESVEVTFKGKPFWIAMVNQKTGNIEKAWTYEEAESENFDLWRYADLLEEDGYVFFTTDLLQDNNKIEYDDYGNRLDEHLIEKINKQISVKTPAKTPTKEATLPERIRKLHDEIGTLNKRLSNVTQWIEGARDWLEQRANNQITFEEYNSRLREDNYYRELDDERISLQEEMDGLIKELEKAEGKPWKFLRSGVLYSTKSDIRYQERTTNGMKPRSLLANALETVAQNDIERNKLREYKEKIDLIEAEQAKLTDLRGKIKDLSFAKGPRDTEAIKNLQFEANQAANRINTYDRQLLTLESTKALKGVLEREKEQARKRAEQKAEQRRKESVEKVKESAAKTEAKLKLQRLILKTAKWISYPSKDDVKCPDIIRAPYSKFLEGIDLSSKRLLEGGDPTHNDERVANAMNNLANAIERITNSQDPSVDTDKVLDSGYLDLPVEFVAKLREMAENITKTMSGGDYVINKMSATDVKQLTKLIRTLNHAIKEMSTLYANLRFANVEALGDNSMSFLERMGEAKGENSVADFIAWNNALPYYAFKRFGEGGESIFEGLMDGQDKLARLAETLFNFKDKTWTDEESKTWGEDTHTIDLPSGNSLTLTTANAMGIYCLSRRAQGLQHLLGGGTRVIGIKKGTKKAADSRSTLTQEDIDTIVASLTDKQKNVAEAIQAFMSSVCAEWGNEVSMKRFLTKEFTDPNYYPIESNDENLAAKDPQAQQSDLYRLLNISATKPLAPGANNEVIIRNIFDVFIEHASDMAKLNAYGLPLLDYMKWANYREKTVNESGQITVRGVHKSMTTAYGDKAWSYVLNLIKDVNGRFNDNGDNSFLMNMMRMQKTASVGNNLRVAFLQFTSYPRASLVLSSKSLALGLTKKPQIEKAKKYCGIALWKSYGFYDTNIAKSIEDQLKGTTDVRQKLIELTMKGPEWADAITWGALWNACEYEVAKNTKNKVGSEEFYHEVGLKLREVVYATQVVDSILTRSQIMRSKSGLTQTETAYMSEPTLTTNILMDAGFQFQKEKRISGSAKVAWKKTGKIVTKAIGNYLVLQLITSIAESLADAWRDDDEEEFLKRFGDAFGENFITNLIPFNKIPIISDFAELLLSFFGIGFVSSDNLATTWVTQAATAVKTWSEVLGEEETSKTVYNAIYQTAKAISSLTGVSVSGAMREVVALWNNTAGAAEPSLKIRQYELTGEEGRSALYKAIVSGDKKTIESLEAEYENQSSFNSAISKALRENDTRIKEAAEARYNGDIAEYMKIAKEIIAEGNFSQDNIVAAINSEVNKLAKEEVGIDTSKETDKVESIFKVDDFFSAIRDGDIVTAYTVKEEIIAADTENGKDHDEAEADFNSKFTTHLREQYEEGNLSDNEAKKMLVNYAGKTEDEAASKVRHWAFKLENPEYSDFSESAVNKYYDGSYKDGKLYGKSAQSYGISLDVYAEYIRGISGLDNKKDIMYVINTLPLSKTQKDALYYLNNWAKSSLHEAPWR